MERMPFDRETIMVQLLISEDEVFSRSYGLCEKLFCAAILRQGTKIAAEILNDYHNLLKTLGLV